MWFMCTFYTDSSNSQLLCTGWNIYDPKVPTQCRGTQAWYHNRELWRGYTRCRAEQWGHKQVLHRAQPDTQDPRATKIPLQLPNKMQICGFRVGQEKYPRYVRRHVQVVLQSKGEWARCKRMLENIKNPPTKTARSRTQNEIRKPSISCSQWLKRKKNPPPSTPSDDLAFWLLALTTSQLQNLKFFE